MISVLRLNFVQPGLDPTELSRRYRAGVEMAAYADANGFMAVSFEEHHGAENGWSPSPLLTAGMVLARTENVRVTIQALLVPLHDPLRLAEDLAVLDLAGGGRLSAVAGLGYRPSEYAAHGKDWENRGALMDHCLDTILAAWTGEPFEHNGAMVRVTPRPKSPPQALLFVGGRTKVAARRAARLGLAFWPVAHMPELDAYYLEQCKEHGTTGFTLMPSPDTTFTFVADDPDKAWADLGHHFLHEAQTYAGWQNHDAHSAAYSAATTVDELRAEGKYTVLTPAECIDKARSDAGAVFVHHPLCGGLPPEQGWESLRLFVDQVVPAVNESAINPS
jgi:alkanesulfonate monooxygenase SsuD/methylene tetrahydromethanopterin reductase-like flavin-dependent oxidoreductase (luciferase family)